MTTENLGNCPHLLRIVWYKIGFTVDLLSEEQYRVLGQESSHFLETHCVVILMLRIPASGDDIASVSCREVCSQFQIRVLGVVEYEEPGL
jgi:hypothetical protein